MKTLFQFLVYFLLISTIIFSQNRITEINERNYQKSKPHLLKYGISIWKDIYTDKQFYRGENKAEERTITNKKSLENGFLLIEKIHQSWKGTEWVNSTKISYTYDENNNRTEYLLRVWNNSYWNNRYKYSYTYDGNNNLIEEIYQHWDGTRWVNEWKYFYTYDGNNNLTEKVSQYWESTKWVNRYRYYYTYDINNNLTEEIIWGWDGNDWINEEKHSYTYDVNNNLTEEIQWYWDGTNWINSEKFFYTYDVNNNLTEEIAWDWDGTYWLNNVKYSYLYDVNNNLTEELCQLWNDTDWANYSKFSNTYDGNNNLAEEFYQKWDGNEWVNTSLSSYTYDKNNNLTLEFQQTWEASDWINSYKVTYKYWDIWNMLLNGDFSDGDNHWDLFVDASASASGTVMNGEYTISIDNGGQNTWDVHLQQSGLLLEKDSSYNVSFDAYSESARQINVFTAMIADPWTIYGYQPVNLNTTKQTYTFSFTMNEATNENARLAFDVGSSTTDVYLDNIELKKEITQAPVADFSATHTNGPAPLTTQFTDQSTGEITSRQWDFGDGKTSSETNPSHTYLYPDTLTVKLTVTGPGGSDTKTRDDYITVLPNPENMLLNGDFSDETNHWLLGKNSSASASGSVQNGEYKVQIDNGGTLSWHVQLIQVGLLIENGKTYEVSFDAYAEAARQIIPYVAMNDSPWTTYGGYQTVTLSTTKQTFTYSFTMNHPTDVDARIVFDVGNSNVNIYFDNIVLIEGTPKSVEELLNGNKIPDSFILYQNYPNPFNPTTTIVYGLHEKSSVVLKIYTVLGSEVMRFAEGRKAAGYYKVSFDASDLPSGIYFYRLQAGSYVTIKKMVLMK
ncbi:MAG: carbohydrate binding domain-containing protein [Ignavibacteriaceae bacterium]